MTDPSHTCERPYRRQLLDARGIFCCYVCDACEVEKKARYRPEIFTDSNYRHDEPIDDDY
jgi:hypothetical protein